MAPTRSRPVVLAAALLVAVLPASCRDDTVRLSFRPQPGERATYRIEVRERTVTTIGDEASRRRVTDTVLRADHRVLDSGPQGSRVEVRLRTEDHDAEAVFVVRFDRAGQAVEVQPAEGSPAGAVADLGLSEVFPAAAAAPPDRPLRPGDRWTHDEPVGPARAGTARLVGEGRLVRLQVAGGRRLARVESSYRTPVRRTVADTDGRLELQGTLRTRAEVAYDLDDHLVHSVRARTRGRYGVTLFPPAGADGVPVPGTLDVEVESTTRRLGGP